MTGPSRADGREYDELAESAAGVERAAHRRRRAWLISAGASALLILLALTVLRAMVAPRERCGEWVNRITTKEAELKDQYYWGPSSTDLAPLAREVDQIARERPPGCDTEIPPPVRIDH